MSPFASSTHGSRLADHACGADPCARSSTATGATAEMLIPMMQDIQTAEGYLPREQLRIARTGAGRAALRGSTAWPPSTAPSACSPRANTRLRLCMGTVCYLKGADQIAAAIQEEFQVAPGGTSPDGKFSFSPVNCLGTVRWRR